MCHDQQTREGVTLEIVCHKTDHKKLLNTNKYAIPCCLLLAKAGISHLCVLPADCHSHYALKRSDFIVHNDAGHVEHKDSFVPWLGRQALNLSLNIIIWANYVTVLLPIVT